MSYQISTDVFEGPLDLLLHLIVVHQIDIYDIPIAEITEQYMAYIYQWQELNLEVAGEFIVMAARLLEMKSRLLLPTVSSDEETEDLRETLVDQLMTYQVFKQISAFLKQREEGRLGIVCKEPSYYPELNTPGSVNIDGEMLCRSMIGLLSMDRDHDLITSYTAEIQRDTFTVEDKITLIRQMMTDSKNAPVPFSDLLSDDGNKSEVIVAFQALLEYYKSGGIRLEQQGLFTEILIYNKMAGAVSG